MMSGDAYRLPVKLTVNGELADAARFEEVEACIGRVRKTLSAGEISYDAEQKAFLIGLTQEDTFSLHRRSRLYLRCKFEGGDVIGLDLGVIECTHGRSRQVI